MKKNILTMIVLLLAFHFGNGQTGYPMYINGNTAPLLSSNGVPLANTSGRVQWLFQPQIFTTAGMGIGCSASSGYMDTIWLRLGNPLPTSGFGDFRGFSIALSQNVGTRRSFASDTFITGLTTVVAPVAYRTDTITQQPGSWLAFPLDTPFLYDASLSLVVEMRLNGYGALGTSGAASAGVHSLQRTMVHDTRIASNIYNASTGTLEGYLPDMGISTRSAVALPIQFVDFEAKEDKGTHKLKWVTSHEQGTRYFNIQRSVDGRKFESIGRMDAIGVVEADDTQNTYFFEDTLPRVGHNFYRIEQLDFNHQKKYSDILDLYVSAPSVVGVDVYPNPTERTLNVRVQADNYEDDIRLVLCDLYGRILRHGVIHVSNREDVIRLDIDDLTNGVYLMELTEGNRRVVHQSKIIKRDW